jgi:hypothetical protein
LSVAFLLEKVNHIPITLRLGRWEFGKAARKVFGLVRIEQETVERRDILCVYYQFEESQLDRHPDTAVAGPVYV